FLAPRLDTVARYRFRGFGEDLINQKRNQGNSASAVGNLVSGDLQEWHVGVELTVPIGFRKAHLAVSNAELLLCRERVIQREQQKQVIHDLVNAIADAERAYVGMENNLNRYLSAAEVVKAYEAKDEASLELDAERLLDAQRRLVDAELQYYRSRVEYAVALKNVHYEKGSLMTYNNLNLLDESPPAIMNGDEHLYDEYREAPRQNPVPEETAPAPTADETASPGTAELTESVSAQYGNIDAIDRNSPDVGSADSVDQNGYLRGNPGTFFNASVTTDVRESDLSGTATNDFTEAAAPDQSQGAFSPIPYDDNAEAQITISPQGTTGSDINAHSDQVNGGGTLQIVPLSE
ncbi:MAG: TolC family protein, partial [Planctomycetaceae bacterium]|nr:TolC family protein [Planctomycetaceae bacterium]